ncbi:MAG: M14 family metallopeptidase [Gammaproteobacteria bacterium]|nr:M14 family metallopeptidase [Gammaproteobacteria bacterium]
MKIRRILLASLLLVPVAQAEEFTYTENDNSGNNIALGYPPPQPVATNTPGAYFREYDFMHAVHQSLAMNNDFIAASIIGQTWVGEDIWAYRFGDPDNLSNAGTAEGSVLVNAGIHAREWQTQEASTGLMEYLASIANDGGVGEYLKDNLNIVIIPSHNTDGFRQTQTFWQSVTNTEAQPRDGRMRRKNLHAPSGATVDDSLSTTGDNLYGVDLNRNSKWGFADNGGSSGDLTNLTYRGASIASEPETQALLNAIDLAPNLRFYEDTHSFSQLMFVPQTGNTKRDEQARNLAQLMSDAVGGSYAVSADPVGGAIGTTADYFAYEFGVPAWTLELEPQYQLGATQYGGIGVSHDGFILPEAEVPRLRDEYNAMHLDTFYDRAGPAHLARVIIRDTTSGDILYSVSWLAGDPNRSLSTAADEALQPGGSYEVWLAFDKPMRYAGDTRAPNIELVPEDGGTALAATISNGAWLAAAGGPPSGYWAYARDAYRFDLDLPTGIADGRWMIVIDTTDATGASLDANPETIVGFENGVWTDYETYYLRGVTDPQEGNSDCNNAVRIGNDSSTAMFNRGNCFNYLADIDGVEPSSGGGGGAFTWLVLAGLLFGFSVKRRRMQ